MPTLSIIIPAPRGPAQFESTLVSVLQNRPADCEVLVVQPSNYDDPYGLSGEVRFVEAPDGASEVELLNCGLRSATGVLLHTLACGVEVPEGWTTRAIRRFNEPRVAIVSPMVLSGKDARRVSGLGIRFTPAGRRLLAGTGLSRASSQLASVRVHGPTPVGGFYRRDCLEAVGGWSLDLPVSLSHLDLSLSLRALGYRTVGETGTEIWSPTGRPALPGYRGGRAEEQLFWRHLPATGWRWAVACHPAAIAWELVRRRPGTGTLAWLLGRLAGCGEVLNRRRFQRKLKMASATLAGDACEFAGPVGSGSDAATLRRAA